MSHSDKPNPPPFSRAETLRWFENTKRDDWWQSQMPISMSALDAVWGEGRIRQSLNPNSPNEMDAALDRIARLIPDIESRRLVFPATKGISKSSESRLPKFLWLEPKPVAVPRLGTGWTLWAYCQSCGLGFNKFLPVSGGQVACYRCCHPAKHNLGYHIGNYSLIHEALKKYY